MFEREESFIDVRKFFGSTVIICEGELFVGRNEKSGSTLSFNILSKAELTLSM
jgi:hypothetical protein